MSELTTFLERMIADDEAVARAAGAEWWGTMEMPPHPAEGERTHWILDSPARLVSYEMTTREYAQHAVEWSPARVLAECAAKRAIVALHAPGSYDVPHAKVYGCFRCISISTDPCSTLRALAQPYAGADGWQEGWAL